MPLKASYSARPACQNRRKKPSSTHAWKRSCAVEEAQSPVALSAFHWQPVRSTKKMAAAQTRSGVRGRPPPRKCGFLCTGKSGSIKAQSSSVNPKQPPVLAMRLARGRRRAFFLAGVVFTHRYRISPRHYPDRQLVFAWVFRGRAGSRSSSVERVPVLSSARPFLLARPFLRSPFPGGSAHHSPAGGSLVLPAAALCRRGLRACH